MKTIHEIIEYIQEEMESEKINMKEIREEMGTENYGFYGALEVSEAYERLLEFINEQENKRVPHILD